MSRLARTLGLAVAATMALTACGGGTNDKDPASAAKPVVLKMANTSSEMKIQPPVSHFADRVAVLSKGSLVIEPVNDYADFASDAEQQVVRDVSNGKVDLGWVGTRGLDTMDVAAFEALTAPCWSTATSSRMQSYEAGSSRRCCPHSTRSASRVSAYCQHALRKAGCRRPSSPERR